MVLGVGECRRVDLAQDATAKGKAGGYCTRRVVTFVKWTGLAWRLRGTCVVSHKSPKRI